MYEKTAEAFAVDQKKKIIFGSLDLAQNEIDTEIVFPKEPRLNLMKRNITKSDFKLPFVRIYAKNNIYWENFRSYGSGKFNIVDFIAWITEIL